MVLNVTLVGLVEFNSSAQEDVLMKASLEHSCEEHVFYRTWYALHLIVKHLAETNN